MVEKFHTPVMLEETIKYLNLKPAKIIVDATIGTAGHSQEILKHILPAGFLIGIDRDKESLNVAKERLKSFSDSCVLVHDNFINLDQILKNLNIQKVDGILFDLGISSFQLDNPERGFSFQEEGPLDMRLDRDSYICAYDLLNNLTEKEISILLWNFGQERWHHRIAQLLVKERQKHPITTTKELSEIVLKAIPYRYQRARIHPATRTFQALRIAVNHELQNLEIALNKAVELLNKGGRICVISFHSLEDRIVKVVFRKFASIGLLKILTPKPLTPKYTEIKENPSSRSSKLRVAERC